MRAIIKLVLVSALAVFSAGKALAATATLNVHVQNESGVAIGSVTVAAMQFGMNGPSTYTLVGLTNAAGDAVFTIQQQMNYNLFVSSHGFSPTIADQFNNPEYDPNRYVWAMNANTVYSTFTMTSGLSGVGRVRQSFAGATANKVLFGGMYNMLAQMPGPSGIVMTDSVGGGTLTVDNVPFAAANTYSIGLYDPEINRGIGRNVMSDLGDGGSEFPGTTAVNYLGIATLNFNNAVPPARVETEPQQGGGSASSNASVEGVLVSTNGVPIPYVGIGVKACVGNQWNTWANADENGRFRLYGLTAGVTYYVNVMGGCSWDQNGPGACYEPYSSAQYNAQDICTANNAVVNPNDIVYTSADVLYHKIQLLQMPRSTGQIRVYVRSSSGYPIPNANVNVNPDGTPWPLNNTACQTPNNWAGFDMRPGFSNANVNTSATGYALLDGLPSGNYNINVWTPFSSGGNGPSGFNNGADGTFTGFGNMGGGGSHMWSEAHCFGTGVDDYRVTITTWTNPTFNVYDSSGVNVGLSSVTYIVTAQGANTGLVRGTLTFPSVADLTGSPIMLTLYPNCGQGPCNATGNFAVISGSGAAQYSYAINVSSGVSYYMNVNAVGWARINRGGGNNMINLQSTGTVVSDMQFTPAGTVTGTLYKPDGTVYTPASNEYVWVDLNSENGWTGTQLQKDGTFTMSDVLPGTNRFWMNASSGNGGSFNYTLPTPVPTVDVTAGQTTSFNLKMVNATPVGVVANLARTPDQTIIGSGYDRVLSFKVIPLSAGTVFKGETLMGMMKGGDDRTEIRYSPATAMMEEGPCGQNWPGGFCAAPMPSPTVADFYLMRTGDFGNMSSTQPAAGNPYPHFVVISSSKNVIIDSAHSNGLVRQAYSMSQSSGVVVNLTPATDLSTRGNATIFGRVSAANFLRQVDYDSLGGDMDKFMNYLPLVSLYDTNGGFKAAGIVVPPPDYIQSVDQNKGFELAMAQGYTQFKALFDAAPYFAYEIRGLAPSTCYTAVMTTPNYPPYQSRVCTGADRSTTTLSIDLDSVVGAGATFQGVVRTTSSVLLAGAVVDLLTEGTDPKSAVTNSSGAFLFQGLPPGTAKIKVSADGYAPAQDELSFTGSSVYNQAYSLTAAGGSITGTVYSQKLPYAKVQAGAQIVAYDDTYNGLNPNAPLPLIKTKTGTDGSYKLTGLIPGDVYKVFLKVTGKYTLSVTTVAVAGIQPNVDFTMLPKPLDIEIFAKKTDTDFEFTVLNPQDFKSGWAGYSVSPFNGVSASTLTLTQLSSGTLSGKIPLSALAAGQTYVLRGIAKSYSGRQVTRELLFGKSYKGNAEQQIDDAILGDDTEDDTGRKKNEVAMDKSGDDASAIMFPPGAVLPVSTGAIPTCSFKGEDKNDDSVKAKVDALGADAFAGNLYTVALTSVTSNENKTVELTLAYDKSTANLDDLSVARYNDTTGKWESFSGVATINPVKGTVKVKLKSLASVLNTRRGSGLQVNSFDGKQYNVRPSAAGSSASGTFAVVRPSIAGNAYAGAKLKVFNYPNPFNLKTKAISNNQGAALNGNTEGTVIHVEVPAGNGGPGHVRIYNLAGEMVNDLATTFTAGAHNYVLWNGRNKGGQPVANGVYYGVVEMSGKSPDLKDATFKMAVIK